MATVTEAKNPDGMQSAQSEADQFMLREQRQNSPGLVLVDSSVRLSRNEEVASNASEVTSRSRVSSSGKEARLKAYHRSRWHLPEEEALQPSRRSVALIVRETEALHSLSAFKELLRTFFNSPSFEVSMGTVIFANAANIGLEQTDRATGQFTDMTSMLEHIFLAIYTVELATRLFAFGLACLRDGWNLFDSILVLMGIVTQWILPIFGSAEEAGFFMVLRTARLMRLAKTVRLLIKFRELWMLIQGLLSSAYTMLYTILLLVVIIYIFACLGLELLFDHPRSAGPDMDPAFASAVQDYFSSLPVAMLSLVQFVCLDNVSLIYGPLAGQDALLCMYFILVILVVGIVVMNLVTAVIVNSALEQTAQDKHLLQVKEDEKKKQLLRSLHELFVRLDDDESGDLTREELQNIDQAELEMLQQLTGMDSPIDIFDALDLDASGEIGIDEFCDGLWQVAMSDTPIEIKRMEKQLEAIRHQVNEQSTKQVIMHYKLSELHETLVVKNLPLSPSSRARPADYELLQMDYSARSLTILEDHGSACTDGSSGNQRKPTNRERACQATTGLEDQEIERQNREATALLEELMRRSTETIASAARAEHLEKCMLQRLFQATAMEIMPPLLDELRKVSLNEVSVVDRFLHQVTGSLRLSAATRNGEACGLLETHPSAATLQTGSIQPKTAAVLQVSGREQLEYRFRV